MKLTPLSGCEPASELAALARRAARLAPDDQHLCSAAAATLTRLGHRAESRQLIEDTAALLDELAG